MPSKPVHNKPLSFNSPPEQLCILRLSALGDATHTVPVVRAIQHHWPDTCITWIIGKAEHRLLSGLEDVEFIVFDKSKGLGAFRDLRRNLKGKTFDLLLHMQVAARANLASLLISAPIKIGWDRARSRDRHHWFVNHSIKAHAFQHQVQGFLSFTRALDIPADEPRWDLPIDEEAQTFASHHLPGEQPTLLISPCSSHTLRNWRPEYYAQVADYAGEHHDMRIVLSGGPGDHEMGTAIIKHLGGKAINLIGKDTLPQSLAMLKRADLVISPDSGPAHMANAVGTKVIGLHACTWSKRSGPYHSLELCVDRFPEAARQFRNAEPEALRWGSRIEQPGVMDLIQPGAVMEKIDLWQKNTAGVRPNL